jgi:hypothetical protein
LISVRLKATDVPGCRHCAARWTGIVPADGVDLQLLAAYCEATSAKTHDSRYLPVCALLFTGRITGHIVPPANLAG